MTVRDDDTILELHRLGELPSALRGRAEALLSTPEGARRLAELELEAERGPREPEIRAAVDGIRHKLRVDARPSRVVPGRPAVWGLSVAGAALGVAFLMLADPLSPRAPGASPDAPASTASAPAAIATDPAAVADRREISAVESGPRPGTAVGSGARRPTPSTPALVAMAEPADDGLRTKGGSARLQVFRIRPGGSADLLRDGDTASTGTLVQVAVTAAERPTWVAVLSVDGSGSVTRHLPEAGDSAVMAGRGAQPPHSFRIDDAPAFERFVLFRADHPFTVAEAAAELREDGAPRPSDLAAQSILLIKNKVVDR